jgi:hypothetical protein
MCRSHGCNKRYIRKDVNGYNKLAAHEYHCTHVKKAVLVVPNYSNLIEVTVEIMKKIVESEKHH